MNYSQRLPQQILAQSKIDLKPFGLLYGKLTEVAILNWAVPFALEYLNCVNTCGRVIVANK